MIDHVQLAADTARHLNELGDRMAEAGRRQREKDAERLNQLADELNEATRQLRILRPWQTEARLLLKDLHDTLFDRSDHEEGDGKGLSASGCSQLVNTIGLFLDGRTKT